MNLSLSFRGSRITDISSEILVFFSFLHLMTKGALKEEGIKASEVDELILSDNELSSLLGLEYFVNVTVLDLSYNRIGRNIADITNSYRGSEMLTTSVIEIECVS